ncbi:hypothetical protein HNR01_004410 [Methylorubrum rhodesianum]|nr:hypothetical protein [Methylorubrum rhodesianum]
MKAWAQDAVQLDELAVHGQVGNVGRVGQGVGLQK